MGDLEDLKQFQELEELRKINLSLEKRLAKAQAKTEDLVDAAREGAREAFLLQGSPLPVPKPPKDSRRKSPEVALLHLSDWQLGKATETFSSDICVQRVRQIGDKVVKLTEIERAGHPVRDCHVLLGGDFVEGTDIFPGQGHEIDAGRFQQIALATRALENLARQLASTFEKVVFWEVEGNHGRQGRKGESPRDDNADLFVYQQARYCLELRNTPGLVWHPRTHWYRIVVIGNYRALLVHGDQIKSFGGNTPAFAIAKKVNSWAAGVLEPFRDCYIGHYHQPLVVPMAEGSRRTFMNPSIESGSQYATEFVGALGAPGQRLHFIDPERGRVTTERILWVE